ncbi:MAG: hypothetical protein OEW68_02115 [Gammaproteobacteria bacterium]|nr:hypothetical protein [Gammaproteobacteria bacterium]MDH4313621.1 hypothetical protein [Gammaproteobacteria bacterium]MDH5500340.1 hypothetical protein [Gammaproteobacteria bacterium]
MLLVSVEIWLSQIAEAQVVVTIDDDLPIAPTKDNRVLSFNVVGGDADW